MEKQDKNLTNTDYRRRNNSQLTIKKKESNLFILAGMATRFQIYLSARVDG